MLESDRKKLIDAMVHIVREWTDVGAEERQQSFGTILSELERLFPDRASREKVQVFVPGAKLARLPFMIAQVFKFSDEIVLSYLNWRSCFFARLREFVTIIVGIGGLQQPHFFLCLLESLRSSFSARRNDVLLMGFDA